ncbi:MAG: hypothetical protein ACRDTT_20920, partial [Pseudonocardiaceae bacterium]
FFKIFPGIGRTINATIASTTTKALGEAFITACTKVRQRQMAGEVIHEEDLVSELLKELPSLIKGLFPQS